MLRGNDKRHQESSIPIIGGTVTAPPGGAECRLNNCTDDGRSGNQEGDGVDLGDNANADREIVKISPVGEARKGDATGEQRKGGGIEACKSMKSKLRITPGKSWGMADGEAQKRWSSLGCDGLLGFDAFGRSQDRPPPANCTARYVGRNSSLSSIVHP